MRIAGMHYQHAMNQAKKLFPENCTKSFDDSLALLLSKKFIYSDAFSRNMNNLGHVVKEAIYDFEPLQKKWANENGISIEDKDWMLACTLDQIRKFEPEVLYFQDVYGLPLEIRKSIKSNFPFIKLMVLHKGFPSHLDELSDFDLIFAGTPGIAKSFTDTGHPNVKLLYHCFDESIKIKLDNSPGKGFSFVGSTGCGLVGTDHKKRYAMLLKLMENTDLEVWGNEIRSKSDFSGKLSTAKNPISKILGYLSKESLMALLSQCYLPNSLKKKIEEILVEKNTSVWITKFGEKGMESLIKNDKLPSRLRPLVECCLAEWRNASCFGFHESNETDCDANRYDSSVPIFPINSLYPQRVHQPIFGHKMYELLKTSFAVFNIHTDAVVGEVGNMRLFETTGVGGCLITDKGSNLKDLFVPDEEVVTYDSVEECVEKLNFLRENPGERDKIALAGHERTIKEHTSFNRCVEIDSYFDSHFS